jgi:predicted kinase
LFIFHPFQVQNAIERLIGLSENDNNRKAGEGRANDADFMVVSETIEHSSNPVNSGAIRKQMGGPTTSSFYPAQQRNFSSSQPMNNNKGKPRENNNNLPDNYDKICTLIRENLKVLVILRGMPGSGKSTLAKNIVKATIGMSGGDNHIISADDYFLDRHGRYFYEREKIGEAHEYTQNRAIKRMQQGWSPLIVDNTNMKVWEMIPYVKMAVTYEYIIKILEPNTTWARVPRLLAKKNTHQVPEAKLRRMLETYEPINVRNILKSLQMEFHMDALPQLRENPPFENKNAVGQEQNVITATATPMNVREIFSNFTFDNNTPAGHQMEWTEKWNDDSKDAIDMTIDEASKRLNLSDIPMPKPPRFLDTPPAAVMREVVKKEEKLPTTNVFETVDWKAHENESVEFWNSQLPAQGSEITPQTLKKEKTKPQPRREVLKELPLPVVDTGKWLF